MLRIGDEISWRGYWGSGGALPAIVKHIVVEHHGGQDGRSVQEVPWSQVTRENVIVSLNNGHWAYGNQIEKI